MCKSPFEDKWFITEEAEEPLVATVSTLPLAQAIHAVPDMIAAIEGWLNWLGQPDIEDGQWDVAVATEIALIAAMRAAAAKARGV